MNTTPKEATWQRLTEVSQDPATTLLPLQGKKYAIISDTHMGDGGDADDFAGNEQALLNALSYYYEQDFELILLGDIEEFWQFDLIRIVGCYDKSVYSAYKQFGKDRVHRVFGNHDFEWGGLPDPTRTGARRQAVADEAIRLGDNGGKVQILLVHGHQGSVDSDKYAWFSRFFVRIFRGIEPLARLTGLYRTGAAPKSPIAKDFERTLYSWAKKNKVMLICGHSHRAMFASKSYAETILDKMAELDAANSSQRTSIATRRANRRQIQHYQLQFDDEKEKGRVSDPVETEQEPVPCYFNSGCGLYSDGLTCIEIENDTILLIKWSNYTDDPVENPLRTIYGQTEGQKSLSDLMDEILA